MQDPRIQAEEIYERQIFDSTAKAVTCGWDIAAGSSIDPNTGGLNLSAEKQAILNWFWENGGSIRLLIKPNDTDATFRRFFFMGLDTDFKIQLGVRGSTGSTILEIRNGSGNNYYTANQTLTVGDFNELLLVWDPDTPSWTSYLNGAGQVVGTVAGANGWGAYDTDYGIIKVGDIAGGSAVTDMDTYQIDLSRRMYTAGEATDLFRGTTFSVLDDSNALLSLPLRSNYNDGVNQVTENIGSLGGTITVGDGTTSSTFPTQLAPKGMSFDGGDYLEASAAVIPATGAFSVSALLTIDSVSATAGICGQYYDTIGERLALGINSTNLFLQIGATTLNYAYGTSIALGRIFHVIAGRDASNNTFIYVDGELVASGTNATNVDQQALMIGRYTEAAVNAPWIGNMYNFRVFRSAITETQAAWLYRKDLNLINI